MTAEDVREGARVTVQGAVDQVVRQGPQAFRDVTMISDVQALMNAKDAGDVAGVVFWAAVDRAVPGGRVAREIPLSRTLHGEAAEHAADAMRAGAPDVLTINRAGAAANREAATGALDAVPGRHLDEYPPAMFREGGAGASVRPINPRDNMSAGACIGNACRGLPDGSRVRITVVD